MDCVCDPVKPETDAVNATDLVRPALTINPPISNDALATDELNDAENEDERDWDSAVEISNPGMIPT